MPIIVVSAAIIAYLFFLLLLFLNERYGSPYDKRKEKPIAPKFTAYFKYRQTRDIERTSYFLPNGFKINVSLNDEISVGL